MDLFNSLMKADAKKVNETREKEITSSRLAELLGQEEPVTIKIRELTKREFSQIQQYSLDKNGNVETSKILDAAAYACAKGVVDPDVRNKDLQEHFGAANAKELCEKIFKSDVVGISSEITALSGYGESDNKDEETIKNW